MKHSSYSLFHLKVFKCRVVVLLPLVLLVECKEKNENQDISSNVAVKGTYSYDAGFLKHYGKEIIELSDGKNEAKVLLSADYQGRVMTSTATGDTGISFGWINYDLISSGKKKKQFNPVGGEERFWIGPEGGQYSIYFKQGDSFNLNHWQVPAVVDTETYNIIQSDSSTAEFDKDVTLTNYSGTIFNIAISRTVRLLSRPMLEAKLHTKIPPEIHSVAYETDNRIKNVGPTDWSRQNGLLSIWLLGMMTPSKSTQVIIPFKPIHGADSLITTTYFGKIPPDRLKVSDSTIYFVCDGKFRSKIGVSPLIAKSIAASFNFDKNVLTLILFPVDEKGLYVNSKWELQHNPYRGDVVNSYNDGPLADGTQLGPFYEIESSSAAKELRKGETQDYQQTTCHLQGNYDSLRALAKKLLGVDLDSLKNE